MQKGLPHRPSPVASLARFRSRPCKRDCLIALHQLRPWQASRAGAATREHQPLHLGCSGPFLCVAVSYQ